MIYQFGVCLVWIGAYFALLSLCELIDMAAEETRPSLDKSLAQIEVAA